MLTSLFDISDDADQERKRDCVQKRREYYVRLHVSKMRICILCNIDYFKIRRI